MVFRISKEDLDRHFSTTNRRFSNAKMMGVMFLTKQEISERLLPPPLAPPAMPGGMMFIAEYPETNLGPGYREAALFLNCMHGEELGTYCLSMPIDSEPLRMHNGRDIFGFPKKMASIGFEREGNVARGWIERNGERYVELRIELSGSLPEVPPSGPTFLFKAMPRIDLKPGFDGPVYLARQKTDVQMKSFEIGTPELTVHPFPLDPWSEVEVVQTLTGFYMISDNTMNPGQIITEVDGEAFLPYYFKMTDVVVGDEPEASK